MRVVEGRSYLVFRGSFYLAEWLTKSGIWVSNPSHQDVRVFHNSDDAWEEARKHKGAAIKRFDPAD